VEHMVPLVFPLIVLQFSKYIQSVKDIIRFQLLYSVDQLFCPCSNKYINKTIVCFYSKIEAKHGVIVTDNGNAEVKKTTLNIK
jgi:hypothetical protein